MTDLQIQCKALEMQSHVVLSYFMPPPESTAYLTGLWRLSYLLRVDIPGKPC